MPDVLISVGAPSLHHYAPTAPRLSEARYSEYFRHNALSARDILYTWYMRYLILILCLSVSVSLAQTSSPWLDVLKLIEQNSLYEAEKALDEIVRFQGESFEAARTRAIIYQKKGDRRQATLEFERAIYRYGKDGFILRALGALYIEEGDTERGLRYLKEAQEQTPNSQRLSAITNRIEREHKVQKSYRTVQRGRFSISFENTWAQPQIKELLARRLEQALQELEEKLWPYRGEIIPVVLYPTHNTYRDVLRAPAWSAAAWDNKLRIPISEQGRLNESAILPLLRHELTHFLIASKVGNRHVPAWLNEGMAETYERRGTLRARSYLKSMKRKRRFQLFTLAQLNGSFARFGAAHAQLAYIQAIMVVTFLKDKYGDQSDVRIIERMSRGDSAAKALERVVGQSYKEFELEFRRWLEDQL